MSRLVGITLTPVEDQPVGDAEDIQRIQASGRRVLRRLGGQAAVNILTKYDVKPERVKDKRLYLRFPDEESAHLFAIVDEGQHLALFEKALSFVMGEEWTARVLVSGLLNRR